MVPETSVLQFPVAIPEIALEAFLPVLFPLPVLFFLFPCQDHVEPLFLGRQYDGVAMIKAVPAFRAAEHLVRAGRHKSIPAMDTLFSH